MPEIRITVQDDSVRAAFKRAKAASQDLRPAFKQIGEYMVGETDERFRNEVAPDGTNWKPLSRKYLQWKQRSGKITKILQLRGRLRSSIVYRAGATQVEIGTNVKYAAIHQFGGAIIHYARSTRVNFRVDRRGRSRFARRRRANFQQNVTIGQYTQNIEARPFLGVNGENQREIGEIVLTHIGEQFDAG